MKILSKISLKTRFSLFFVLFVLAVFSVVTITSVQQINDASGFIASRLGFPIVERAAALIDGDAFEKLAKTLDPEDPFYEETRKKLLEIKEVTDCLYLYTMSPYKGNIYRFIIDGGDPGDEKFSPLGAEEDISGYSSAFLRAYEKKSPQYTQNINSTETWGRVISAFAPILNSAGTVVGIIGCDFEAESQIRAIYARTLRQLLVAAAFIIIGFVLYRLLIHEVIRQNQWLVEANKKAEMASKSKGYFLANMSHEIRTPMNAIIGIADLMRTDNLDETQREYLADIKKTSGSLLNIINDILDFSKIEAGKMTLVRTHYNLFALFDNIRSITEFFAAEKALRLECGIDENLPRLLYGDEGRVRQIVMNLVSNAVKYTRKGHVSLRFRRTAKNEREYLSITVTDTGIGIRQEDFPRLFESFEQLDKNKNRGIAGTGLGLAVTKRLVDLMDGELSFASEYGKGSEFTVLLPLAEGDPLKAEITKLRKRCTVSPDARILVVDDNALNLTVAQGFLARHG
ncbi:MAG: hypothetical protein LBQ51_06775, partial [Desulfovibrio sp.]|nr:hypothetical protein [Desulfovibrio sp.]